MTIGTKVLLIDDHQLTRSLLRGLLREADYVNIREAVDAVSGLKMAEHFVPDLVCLDIQMPTMSGLEALKLIRAEEEAHGRHRDQAARVIITTASDDRETKSRAFHDQSDAYIVKPIDAEELIDLLHCLVPLR